MLRMFRTIVTPDISEHSLLGQGCFGQWKNASGNDYRPVHSWGLDGEVAAHQTG